ncbi:MAG: fumarate reductase/succinate dehydrogenase flavoprotein subunit [Methanobacteriota archaeon]|nr:MAG: fumarate reductase/succinate dehydrogenase flavoprotein subunit [Euryarchaeota archaeon]
MGYNVDEELKKVIRKSYDVLIIGAGGAGLRAAIAAAEAGVNVGVVTKSLLGKAHTVMAEGGAAAALGNVDSRDNWKVHFRDTMKGGKYHNNWRMVEIFAKEAPERIRELEMYGAVFDRTEEGKIKQRNFGGHKYPRLAHVGDRTGLELIRTLQDKAIHFDNLHVEMETTITKLIVENEEVKGAFGYNRQTGELIAFSAKSVIIATGGFGKVFRVTSNSWELTGDGESLAYREGVELTDMEFIQFHPTGMVYPNSVKGTLVTEGVRGEGGILLNNKGERFMFRYIPEMFKVDYAETEEEAERWFKGDPTARRPPELLTRDVVAKAIIAEVKAGRGSPHGGAFLDIASRRTPEEIKRVLPSMHHQFLKLAKLDITKEPMEVGPTAHYAMGGIRVDGETQETNIKGIFAAGEAAAGLHGANRLGGNSLTDLIVFGKIAGDHAAKRAKEVSQKELNDEEIKEAIEFTLKPFDESNDEDPYQLHAELKELMEEYVGIIRDEKGLTTAIEKLKEMMKRADRLKAVGDTRTYNSSWHQALDIKNMVTVALIIATAALQRKESRGGHTREDYPETDESLTNVLYVIKKGEDGFPVVSEATYPPMPDELVQAMKEVEEE